LHRESDEDVGLRVWLAAHQRSHRLRTAAAAAAAAALVGAGAIDAALSVAVATAVSVGAAAAVGVALSLAYSAGLPLALASAKLRLALHAFGRAAADAPARGKQDARRAEEWFGRHVVWWVVCSRGWHAQLTRRFVRWHLTLFPGIALASLPCHAMGTRSPPAPA
jgi:hypothetical protein